MRALAALIVVLALAVLYPALVAAQPNPPPYVVIVNPRNDLASVDRKFLEDAFLKKVTRWPNDETIRPVDLPARSPIRRRFTMEVLGRTVDAVKLYWQQRIFSGRDVPPPELDTDAEVVQYVLRHGGAVGYVSGGASLDGSKVLGVR
jgi:ABC-type phosphate transport system substrate-binding protein